MNDVIKELQDMRHLQWSKTRHSSGTAGSFLKSYDDYGERKLYYKLSDYDLVKGIVGHECINEIVAQRLLDIFGIDHLKYTLIHSLVLIDGKEYETYLCSSYDFKDRGESKIALEDYYVMERKDGELPMTFCKRMGWHNYIYGMLVLDYLILNRDRHGANIEVLRSPKKGTIRLAPLFDQGLSLCYSCHDVESLVGFDVMEDRRVQSFVGSNSTFDNVKTVPKTYLKKLPTLTQKDGEHLFGGLEGVISKEHMDKIWEMIWGRWKELEDIRNT